MSLLLSLLLASPLHAEQGQPLAGAFVKSDRWEVNRQEGRKVEEFSGNVSYRREGRTLNADWASFDHVRRRWRAKGRVRAVQLTETGETVTAEGEEALHDMDTGQGRMHGEGGVRVRRVFPDGRPPEDATARRLEWDEKAKTFWLVGDVRLKDERGQARSDRAVYMHDERATDLEGGRPVLSARDPKWTAAVQADRIKGASSPRRITADGKTRGWLHFPEKDKYLKER